MAQKRKLVWIELLRIAGCYGVITMHMAAQYFRQISVESYEWRICNFFHGFFRFSVPCYMMISGYLYLGKKVDLKHLYKKNILPLVTAFFFWQWVYAIYRIVTEGKLVFGSSDFWKRVLIYMSKPYFHLWYLPMLIGFLIIMPLVGAMLGKGDGKRWAEYFLILYLIFQVMPLTVGYFPLPQQQYIINLMNLVRPWLVTSYAGYFVMGYYLGTYNIHEKAERSLYVLGFVLIVAGIWLCSYYARRQGTAVQSFYENSTLPNVCFSAAVFLFFKNHLSQIRWNPKTEAAICYLGKCTLGIYLIHALLRDILNSLGINSLSFHAALAIPMIAMVIFVGGTLLVMVIKKVPVIGKWIV